MNENRVLGFCRRVFPHVVAVGIVCGLLTAGLWPFHAPRNQVDWLGGTHGVHFGEYAYLVSNRPFPAAPSSAGHSLEIWLEAGDPHDTNTFLTFYRSRDLERLVLGQYGRDITIQQQVGTAHYRPARLDLPDAFPVSRPVLLTVVAGTDATSAYLDGRLVRTTTRFVLEPDEFAGTLLIGNSPFKDDSWGGRLLGLALYARILSSAEVQRHSEDWIKAGTPDPRGNEHPEALYLFGENRGEVARSQVPDSPDLRIPYRYNILSPTFLQPFWEEFDLSPGFWKNVFINIAGFIPFGLVFRAYLSFAGQKGRVCVLVIFLGFLISLTIEVFQGFLPTRQSGTTDLFSNTLGTAIGVAAYRWCPSLFNQLMGRG